MKRLLSGAALTTLLVLGIGAGAWAGEVTGKGDPTPIQSYRAGSICSFSGQNDDPDSTEPLDGGRVQSFGDLVQEVVRTVGYRGASTLTGDIATDGPGAHCRGYASSN